VKNKQGYAVGDPCSDIKVPLDSNVLNVSGTFACYYEYSVGSFYTMFAPDMTTTRVTSSANPAYAQCLVANITATSSGSYLLPFNISGDWANCITNTATYSPTPRTFAPTTTLQGELTLGALFALIVARTHSRLTHRADFSSVPAPLKDYGSGALFGAYTVTMSQCTPSAQRPACLRCAPGFLTLVYAPYYAQAYVATCHLETETWSSQPTNVTLFGSSVLPYYAVPCVWQAKLGVELDFSYTLGCSYAAYTLNAYGNAVVGVQLVNASLSVNATDPAYATCIGNSYTIGNSMVGFAFNASVNSVLCRAPTLAPTRSPTKTPVVSHPSAAPTRATQSPGSAPSSAADAVNVPLIAGAAGGAAVVAFAALAVLLLVLHRKRARIANETRMQAGGLRSNPNAPSAIATANPKFQRDINV